MTKTECYLDNAATTKMSPIALESMIPYFSEEYGNPSSTHNMGKVAYNALVDNKKIISNIINCEESELYLTSGGSESNNWALFSIANSRPGSKIIISSIEHSSILEPCKKLKQLGHEVVLLSVDHVGEVDYDELLSCIDDNTSIVSIMHANNEIGTIQNIKKISDIVHKHGAIFHTDAVQTVGHIPIDVKELGVDLLSASAHKFNGPRGIGFLYCHKSIKIAPLIFGGHQQNGLRAGTENLPGLVGMAIALLDNVQKMKENAEYLKNLENLIYAALKQSSLDYVINGNPRNKLPGIISISFKNVKGDALADILSIKGIYVSTGSACNSKENILSHVLDAIALDERYAHGTVRLSLSKYNGVDEVMFAINTMIKILESLQNKLVLSEKNNS